MSEQPAQGLTALAQEFVELVELLFDAERRRLTTDRIVEVACHACGPAEHAAVTVVDDGRLRTEAATGAPARRVDDLASELGRGPAFDAVTTSHVVRVDDLDAAHGWPVLGPRVVAETGVRSVLACRIYLSRRRTASLNLYSSWPAAFDDGDVATAAILASYCSLALLTDLLDDAELHPDRARESHREVGIAIGLLMARRDVSAEQALDELRRASRELNRSLPDIARAVTGRTG
ncbi:GAF and ANTAR domain-containing protein [Rhodococcus aerolatus]